jgi:hypothetical protein
MKSISYKIAFGSFIIIFINVTITLYAIYYLNRLSSPIEQSTEEQIKNINTSEALVTKLAVSTIVTDNEFKTARLFR